MPLLSSHGGLREQQRIQILQTVVVVVVLVVVVAVVVVVVVVVVVAVAVGVVVTVVVVVVAVVVAASCCRNSFTTLPGKGLESATIVGKLCPRHLRGCQTEVPGGPGELPGTSRCPGGALGSAGARFWVPMHII